MQSRIQKIVSRQCCAAAAAYQREFCFLASAWHGTCRLESLRRSSVHLAYQLQLGALGNFIVYVYRGRYHWYKYTYVSNVCIFCTEHHRVFFAHLQRNFEHCHWFGTVKMATDAHVDNGFIKMCFLEATCWALFQNVWMSSDTSANLITKHIAFLIML